MLQGNTTSFPVHWPRPVLLHRPAAPNRSVPPFRSVPVHASSGVLRATRVRRARGNCPCLRLYRDTPCMAPPKPPQCRHIWHTWSVWDTTTVGVSGVCPCLRFGCGTSVHIGVLGRNQGRKKAGIAGSRHPTTMVDPQNMNKVMTVVNKTARTTTIDYGGA